MDIFLSIITIISFLALAIFWVCRSLKIEIPISKIKKGRWEVHPCLLPDTDNKQLTAKGHIWRCHCGRRWKYIESKRLAHYSHQVTDFWKEQTPEMDLADAERELAEVEKMANKKQHYIKEQHYI
jgi:Holliday junction resolvase RusA-like endonuclease